MNKQNDPIEQIDDDWAEKVSIHPGWDQDIADELIGAIVLVGISEIDDDEVTVEQYQMWGMVEAADPESGIEIELHGELAGESWVCPPDLDAFETAAPGVYKLHATGEEIGDPEFITSWTFSRSEDDAEDQDGDD